MCYGYVMLDDVVVSSKRWMMLGCCMTQLPAVAAPREQLKATRDIIMTSHISKTPDT